MRKDSASTSRTSGSSSAISTRMNTPPTASVSWPRLCRRGPSPATACGAHCAGSSSRSRASALAHRSGSHPERIYPRDIAADDQGVDVVRTLIGIHGLQIHHMANDRVLVHDSGGPHDVTGQARGVERHLAVVHLRHRDLLGPGVALVFEPPELQAEELSL